MPTGPSCCPRFHHLHGACRPKDMPQHAEVIEQAVDAAHAAAFVAVLEGQLANMSASQAARVRRVIAKTHQEDKDALP